MVGRSNRELIWSIDDCRIDPLGFNREIANPFADAATSTDPIRFPQGGDVNPVLLAINRDPKFSPPLSPELLSLLARAYPDSVPLGKFLVRWTE